MLSSLSCKVVVDSSMNMAARPRSMCLPLHVLFDQADAVTVAVLPAQFENNLVISFEICWISKIAVLFPLWKWKKFLYSQMLHYCK